MYMYMYLYVSYKPLHGRHHLVWAGLTQRCDAHGETTIGLTVDDRMGGAFPGVRAGAVHMVCQQL